MALEASRIDEASAEIDKALKINPRSLEAHSLRAAMLYLQDKDFEPEVAATLAIGPKYGELYNTLSHYATITRRTEQAAQFARRATEISPRLWDAHLNLGMALLRLGQMEPGAKQSKKRSKAIRSTSGPRTRSTCSTRCATSKKRSVVHSLLKPPRRRATCSRLTRRTFSKKQRRS